MKRLFTGLMVLFAITATSLVVMTTVASADGTVQWTGHGVTDGVLNTVQCDENNTPYLFWVFTLGGGKNTVTSATLTVNGVDYVMAKPSVNAGVFQVSTPFSDLSTLSASVAFVGNLGKGAANLNISHGCPGETPPGGPQPASIEIQKVVVGDAGTDQFEFFIDGVSVGVGADGFDAVKEFVGIEGDQGHTVSEVPLQSDEHQFKSSVVCTSDTEGVVAQAAAAATTEGDVSLRAGEHVTCVFTNVPDEVLGSSGGKHHHKCHKRDTQCKAAKLPTGVTNQQLVADSGSRVQGG